MTSLATRHRERVLAAQQAAAEVEAETLAVSGNDEAAATVEARPAALVSDRAIDPRSGSLARRHRERALAAALAGTALASAPLAANVGPEATEYQLMLAQLGEDLRALSNIQSIERKIDTKRAMIAGYQAWVDGALRAGGEGRATQDEIVTTMLVWYIDTADWIMALQVAVHVLSHGLALPERYKRTPATLIAEEIADAALADVSAVDHGTLIATAEITTNHDMPDQVRAKLNKALGRNLQHQASIFDPDANTAFAGGKPALISAALDALRRALKLDEKVGVKKDIETLERELNKLTAGT